MITVAGIFISTILKPTPERASKAESKSQHCSFYPPCLNSQQPLTAQLACNVSVSMSPHALDTLSPMEDLTRKLASDVEMLTEYIQSTGGVQPSFDRDCPASVIPQDAPLEAQQARERIMDQCLKLLQLATGPSDYMINIQTGVCSYLQTGFNQAYSMDLVSLHCMPSMALPFQHIQAGTCEG